jgi:hypothetical protein
VGKAVRHYIPGLQGEYFSDDEIRLRAREHFLWAIAMVTPRPLHSLRDEILPKYRAAFEFEQRRGKTFLQVKQLSVQALVDVVLQEEIVQLKSLPAYRKVRDSFRSLYEATDELIDWSKSYHLTGKRLPREKVEPGKLGSARVDSVWPLIAAMETILQWHFSPAGVLQTLKKVPLWRPKPFDTPKNPGPLPAIRLTTIYQDPRASIPNDYLTTFFPDGVTVEPPRVVDTPAWHAGLEPIPEFRRRVTQDFKRWLDHYIAVQGESARLTGLSKGPGKRNLVHFIWTAMYQIDELPATKIVNAFKDNNVTAFAVEKAVATILDVIRLEPRPARPGRRPQNVATR